MKTENLFKSFNTDLDPSIQICIIQETEKLLQDLENHRLEVTLIPAPEPQFVDHKIRVAVSENPRWYKKLFAIAEVKRRLVIKSLYRIKNRKVLRYSIYDNLIFHLVIQHLKDGYEGEFGKIPPNNVFRKFLNMKPVEIDTVELISNESEERF